MRAVVHRLEPDVLVNPWVFLLERAVSRGLKLRPFRIYSSENLWAYLSERDNTLLFATLRSPGRKKARRGA